MPVKNYKPTSPGRRHAQRFNFDAITTDAPEKSLTRPRKQKSGRNNTGRVTVRHRGGGAKRRVRVVDFHRRKDGVPGKVASIEYDPGRSARIALVHYADGEKRYILANKGLKVGHIIMNGEKELEILPGNTMPIEMIPLGTLVHNVEIRPDSGGCIARSAGNFAQIVAKDGKHAHVRLPSGEVRLIHQKCRATIGEVGNEDHGTVSLGKAGRKRWKGIRPTVRGTVMNPCDHPNGGGEGKNKVSGRQPVSPWGVLAKGGRTRKKRKSNRMIVASRHSLRKR